MSKTKKTETTRRTASQLDPNEFQAAVAAITRIYKSLLEGFAELQGHDEPNAAVSVSGVLAPKKPDMPGIYVEMIIRNADDEEVESARKEAENGEREALLCDCPKCRAERGESDEVATGTVH